MRNAPKLRHCPPHLEEVCEILATGLIRLRRHTAENLAADGVVVRDHGEISLHFTAHRSGHANPSDKERA
jgi:hypothetical protein